MELIAGAALGSAFGELLKAVIDQTQQTVEFNTHLTRLETTLKKLEPLFNNDITELNKKLNQSVEETTKFLKKGKELVIECSRIKRWNAIDRLKCAKKLTKLDNELLRFFQIDAQAILLSSNLEILNKVSTPTSSAGAIRVSGSCSVPGLHHVVIGMDQRLAELKDVLLKDETRLLVISAPGGFGKTTLAKMLCHDPEIKGLFGDNILYVTVSTETSIMNIAKKLFKHYGIDNVDLSCEEDAKNQIENLIQQKGSSKMLLVLDDVWSKSESVIEDLKFEIPGFKILVTSRSQILKFSSTTYDLRLLNAEYAKTLFCHSTFPHDGSHVNNVRDDLVNKMVEFCKGIPLALTVVGASLCGQPEVIWKATLKKWTEGQSILESHQRLLLCLQTSIDALDELNKNCFLDLGLFPEDDEIEGVLLMDMWVELYKLDDEGVYAAEKLLNLKSRNLINLVKFRKATAGETEGHCSQYRVTQHDVLRELAIHMSRQEPAKERKRLFIEINSNNFPEWWIQVAQQPVNARILSISTDEKFNSTWCDLNAPNVEVLILNVRSKNYTLPRFIERMIQLKVLIVTGYGVYPTQLDNPQILGFLSKLNRIRFEHVSVSPSVQVIFTLKTLKKLTFVMCKIGNTLDTHTEYRYMLENLTDLEIDLCYDLKELPAGLCSSVHLQKLIITNCQELDPLPEDLGNLSNLEIMRLHCCTNLKELPESIRSLRKLRLIDISDCSSITALPEQIGELNSLRVIDIRGCEALDKLPMSLARLQQLEDVWCDEERSYLWKNIESDHCNVKINLVEEDRTGTFKKIC